MSTTDSLPAVPGVKPLDPRPYISGRGWAPGNYICTCVQCNCRFMGEKRAHECADCAYAYDAVMKARPIQLNRAEVEDLIRATREIATNLELALHADRGVTKDPTFWLKIAADAAFVLSADMFWLGTKSAERFQTPMKYVAMPQPGQPGSCLLAPK